MFLTFVIKVINQAKINIDKIIIINKIIKK